MSNAAHPGFTRTNLQTAGASLGRDKPKRNLFNTNVPAAITAARAGDRAVALRRHQPRRPRRRLLRTARGFMELVGETGTARMNRHMRDAPRSGTPVDVGRTPHRHQPSGRGSPRLIAGSCAEAAGTFHQVRRRAFFSARA